jgi:hypothetical protein
VSADDRHPSPVWGILLLLLVGYVWLSEWGVGSSWVSSLTAVAFGVGAALTLDEFALWLNLQDVYWEQQGRESVDAVVLFASLLSVGIWGGPFLRGVVSEVLRLRKAAASDRPPPCPPPNTGPMQLRHKMGRQASVGGAISRGRGGSPGSRAGSPERRSSC